MSFRELEEDFLSHHTTPVHTPSRAPPIHTHSGEVMLKWNKERHGDAGLKVWNAWQQDHECPATRSLEETRVDSPLQPPEGALQTP